MKEKDKNRIAVDTMFYFMFIFVGELLVWYPNFLVVSSLNEYVIRVFYMLGALSLIAYFLSRRKNDYEYLFLSLINVVIGAYIIFGKCSNRFNIFEKCILLYTVLLIVNKFYHSYILGKDKNIEILPKIGITFVLIILVVLMFVNSYNYNHILFIGYYFIVIGVLSLLELGMHLLIKEEKVNKYLKFMLNKRNNSKKR